MTFATNEESAILGDPVECYLFRQGEREWRWTSSDADVTLPDFGVFLQSTISRGAIKHSQEAETGSCEVYVPRTNPVAALFIPDGGPTVPVRLQIIVAHRGDEANAVPIFSGRVPGAGFKGGQATLGCSILSAALNNSQAGMVISAQCPRVLFSSGCDVAQSDFSDVVTVDSVTGRTVVAAAFDDRADGWYTNGKLIHPAGGRAFVVAHVGDAITLSSALPDLEAGDTVTVTAGCDGLEATCASKFDNRINCLAFSRLPPNNPYATRFKR